VTSATFKVRFARRMPDPIFNQPKETVERHIFMCAVEELPTGLPKDPNPRRQNTDRRIYRTIGEHLLNREGTPNTFHLKNKGITLLAEEVRKLTEELYEVRFVEGQGIVDGAHSYELILQHLDEIKEVNSGEDEAIQQFIKVEILTGIDRGLVAEIAGGLNTAIQVQQMSLANLDGKFEWIKNLLDTEPYSKDIAYREGEIEAIYDVRDILVLLELFNITDFPNEGNAYPTRAYTSKEAVLDNYLNKPSNYERLAPILKDILKLHDIIHIEAGDLYNKAGGRAGKLAFMEKRERGQYKFPFIGKQGNIRLTRGALFPMLGAFRWMVRIDPDTDNIGWRGGFTEVYLLWKHVGGELMQATKETSDELGRNPTAIGKSRNHWGNLHNLVAKRNLLSQR
jgi:hypothetical protein